MELRAAAAIVCWYILLFHNNSVNSVQEQANYTDGTANGNTAQSERNISAENSNIGQPSIANDSNVPPALEERFSGSGTGSGSTSGREDVEEEEDEICPELPQNEHNNSEDIISSTAYSEVFCHVACMEEVANSSNYANARIQSGIFAGVHAWRYLTFPEFKGSDRKNTCPAYRKFKLCYKGCLVRTQPTKANLTRNQCKRDCKTNCTEEKKADSYYNSYCEVKCYPASCLLGCDKFAEIKKAQNTTGSPEGPVTGPQLVTTGPGLFQLKHTVSAPAQNTVHPVGLVYHIVDILTRVTVFMSQVDSENINDLQRFACRRISVSYAAVNRFGASVESPPVLLTIPGALNPPTIESVSRDVDTRLGFFGYGVVTVSWQHPKSSVYIEHYTVKMFSFSADKSKQTWNILNNVTILTIRAETTGNLFRLGTPYTFQVCSVSGDEEECDEKYYRLPPVPDTVLQITSCDSHWTGTHFHYTIQWNIPDYIAFVGGIIDSFNMGASLQYKGGTVSYYASGVVEKHTNQTTYSTTRTNYRPQTSDYSYHFTISIHWIQSVQYSLPNVISKDCTVKALPPPPSPVLNVSISGIAIAGENLQFQFSWDPPTSTNGDVAEYMACLSNQVLDDENEKDFSFYGSNDDVTCVDLNKTSSSQFWDRRVPLSDCAFFQMRARTEYRVGDWSEEIAISTRPYDGISLECLVVDVSEDEMSSVEVSWTMQNETFCIHLEAAPIHSVEITLEATDENSSLIASLASVKLPLSKIEYTFSDIPASNDSVFFIEFEVTGNQMKPYNKVLMAECVRVLPSSLTPSNTATDTTAETTSDATTYTIISVKALSVVLGVAIAIIILSSLLPLCMIYRRRWKLRKALKSELIDTSNVMFTGGVKKPTIGCIDIIPTDEWELPPGQVIVESILGEGAFGEVYKGSLRCPLSNPKVPAAIKSAIGIKVAIKMLKCSAKGSERRDFLQEIELMKKVAEGQNPHVVAMVGCVTVQEPLSLITEYVAYGNLLHYLRTSRKMYTEPTEVLEQNSYVGLGNVTPLDLISFAYQIASGMEYLSSLGIVHRDLACRNILVGEGKVLKITDLGMSREANEVYVQKTKGRVPLKWMAVESIITREFTSASDVWAYGVILWEIGTLGGFPYPSILNVDLLPLLKQGYRMEKPDNCSTEVYDIMLQCWLEEPSKRPTFSQLRARFDSMLLAEKKDTYIDLQIDASKPYYQAEWSDTKETDEKPSKWGSQDSIKSLLNASSEMIPASFDPPTNCSPKVQLHGQRSLQSLSPGTDNDKAQRPVSLQLLSDRRNINHYVDDPFTRKSIVFDPPESDPEHQRQVSQDDEPDGMNWNEGGGGKRGGEESSDGRGGGRAEGGRDYVAGGLGGGGSLEGGEGGGEGSGGGGGGGSDEENEGGEGVAGDGGGGEDGSGGGGGSGGGRRGFGVEKCDGEANTQNEVTDEQDVNIVPVFVISFS